MTVVYLLLYYGLMLNVLKVKLKLIKAYKERGERFDRYRSNDPEMLAADRNQLNLLEHMPPFLIVLWLYAVFVSALLGDLGGALYLVLRVLYPFVLGTQAETGHPNAVAVRYFWELRYSAFMLLHLVWSII